MNHQRPLSNNTIHVWRASLFDSKFNSLIHLLSEEDVSKKELIVFDRDKVRFQNSRIFLRQVLSTYLKEDPCKIIFNYNEFKKPNLIHKEIKFNLSHSKDEIVVAISLGTEVGVDVEYIDDQKNLKALLSSIGSERENLSWYLLDPKNQLHSFYKIWTQKESLLKALGTGIVSNLKSIEVEVLPTMPHRLFKSAVYEELNKFDVLEIHENEHYSYSIAFDKKEIESLQFFEFQSVDFISRVSSKD